MKSLDFNIKKLVFFLFCFLTLNKVVSSNDGMSSYIDSSWFDCNKDPLNFIKKWGNRIVLSHLVVYMLYRGYKLYQTYRKKINPENKDRLVQHVSDFCDIDVSIPWPDQFGSVVASILASIEENANKNNKKNNLLLHNLEKKISKVVGEDYGSFGQGANLGVLSGPPGLGKTYATKVIFKKAIESGSYDDKSIYVSLGQAELNTGYIGQAPEIIGRVFSSLIDYALKNPDSLVMVVLDEVDWFLACDRLHCAFGPDRDPYNEAKKETANAFIREIDKVLKIPNFVILGTTNLRSSKFDRALTRSGRLLVYEVFEYDEKKYINDLVSFYLKKYLDLLENIDVILAKELKNCSLKDAHRIIEKIKMIKFSEKSEITNEIKKFVEISLETVKGSPVHAIKYFFNRRITFYKKKILDVFPNVFS